MRYYWLLPDVLGV
jgi:Protein of unknown function (DUF1360)